MSSQLSLPAGQISPSGSIQLFPGQLPGHPVSIDDPELQEFAHWFETEDAKALGDLKYLVTLSLRKFNGWDSKTRECILESYRKTSGHSDIIVVRCNKLPRVFIAPRLYFDYNVKFIEVAGELPIIVEEDATIYSNIDHFSESQAQQYVSVAATTAYNVDDASVPATAGAAPRRVGRNVVARPPNCFILFRQHLHPMVVRDNPGLHNNVISTMISKMWHGAPSEIREQYKELAAEAKRQHKLLYPDYHYEPRKSSEKKRRMTKKKAAALEAAAAQSAQQFDPAGETFDGTFPMDSDLRDDIVNHNLSLINASMEPQGLGLDLQKPLTYSDAQFNDLQSSAEAFNLMNAGPREDFPVRISADHPEYVYLDVDTVNANQAGAFADVTSQEDFADVYRMINGNLAGGPPNLAYFSLIANELYEFEPLAYDYDLHGTFSGTE
ncbi:uncharacterized protein RAG0_07016 [Rhynchosporium agropyri]|uniref:HMG box domain-containing protein n=1 Tax=Rhynchosporium agropyri TaxID=914238 RepID=A0A1E1KJI9_9HELO|nr:uncharacterized protein RAG0_07016 [Rhynchosporium agropyri]